MTERSVELVYFSSCPNADPARDNIRAALAEVGAMGEWVEWDLEGADTPARCRAFGSPTVLVNGSDVLGAPGTGDGISCRAEGAPTVPQIVEAITGNHGSEGEPGQP